MYSLADCSEYANPMGLQLTEDQHVCYGSDLARRRNFPAGTSVGDTGGPLLDVSRTCFIGVSTFSVEFDSVSIFTRADYFREWMRDVLLESRIQHAWISDRDSSLVHGIIMPSYRLSQESG